MKYPYWEGFVLGVLTTNAVFAIIIVTMALL